jgi:hypothetical protein
MPSYNGKYNMDGLYFYFFFGFSIFPALAFPGAGLSPMVNQQLGSPVRP